MNATHHIVIEPTTKFITIAMEGKLTHEDYEYLNNQFDEILSTFQKTEVNVLIDALRLTGWELQAAWDDLKFGLKYDNNFHKIAFVGNKPWEKYGISISNWFMHSQMRYFETIEDAQAWLKY